MYYSDSKLNTVFCVLSVQKLYFFLPVCKNLSFVTACDSFSFLHCKIFLIRQVLFIVLTACLTLCSLKEGEEGIGSEQPQRRPSVMGKQSRKRKRGE